VELRWDSHRDGWVREIHAGWHWQRHVLPYSASVRSSRTVAIDDSEPASEPASGSTSILETAGQVATAVLAREGLGSSRTRQRYGEIVSRLNAGDKAARTAAKDVFREETPPIAKAVVHHLREKTGITPGSGGTANRTNPTYDRVAKSLGHVGRASAMANVALGGYRIAHAEDRVREAIVVVSETGGALAGASGGALLGCALGPWGCAGGALIGAFAGGFGGGAAAGEVYDALKD